MESRINYVKLESLANAKMLSIWSDQTYKKISINLWQIRIRYVRFESLANAVMLSIWLHRPMKSVWTHEKKKWNKWKTKMEYMSFKSLADIKEAWYGNYDMENIIWKFGYVVKYCNGKINRRRQRQSIQALQ